MANMVVMKDNSIENTDTVYCWLSIPQKCLHDCLYEFMKLENKFESEDLKNAIRLLRLADEQINAIEKALVVSQVGPMPAPEPSYDSEPIDFHNE